MGEGFPKNKIDNLIWLLPALADMGDTRSAFPIVLLVNLCRPEGQLSFFV